MTQPKLIISINELESYLLDTLRQRYGKVFNGVISSSDLKLTPHPEGLVLMSKWEEAK